MVSTMIIGIALLIAIAMFIISYISDRYCLSCNVYGKQITSFAAGILIAYLLIDILPRFYEFANGTNILLLIVPVITFSLFYIAEKYFYSKHAENALFRRLRIGHATITFLDEIAIGLLFILFLSIDIGTGLLFVIPLLIVILMSNTALHQIHGFENRLFGLHGTFEVLKSSGGFIGIGVALLFVIPAVVTYIVFGGLLGLLIYVVIREEVPRAQDSNSIAFSIGALVYSLIILLTLMV